MGKTYCIGVYNFKDELLETEATGREIWGQDKKHFLISGVVLQCCGLPGTMPRAKLQRWTRGFMNIHEGGKKEQKEGLWLIVTCHTVVLEGTAGMQHSGHFLSVHGVRETRACRPAGPVRAACLPWGEPASS